MLNKYCVTPKANPLLEDIQFVQARIAQLKQRTKRFYFRVLLSKYNCLKCSGGLTMTDKSQCLCSCGNIFDPTLAFQKSTCCGTQLVRRTFHYVCSRCKKVSPSRFIFDERIFDREYFSRMMQASRAKARKHMTKCPFTCSGVQTNTGLVLSVLLITRKASSIFSNCR